MKNGGKNQIVAFVTLFRVFTCIIQTNLILHEVVLDNANSNMASQIVL